MVVEGRTQINLPCPALTSSSTPTLRDEMRPRALRAAARDPCPSCPSACPTTTHGLYPPRPAPLVAPGKGARKHGGEPVEQ